MKKVSVQDDPVKSDNKKALFVFIPVLIAVTLIGGVIGFFSSAFDLTVWRESFYRGLNDFLKVAVPLGIPAGVLVLVLPANILLVRAHKRFAAWDGENEAQADAIENLLNHVMLLLSIMMPFGLFVLSAGAIYLTSGPLILLTAAEMFAETFYSTYLSQKCTDLVRRMNPEKQGSVYDLHFRKKWVSSCDENERRQIGIASYASFRAVNTACMILWLLTLMGHVLFDVGILPSFCIMVIFTVSQVSYIHSCIRQNKAMRPAAEKSPVPESGEMDA